MKINKTKLTLFLLLSTISISGMANNNIETKRKFSYYSEPDSSGLMSLYYKVPLNQNSKFKQDYSFILDQKNKIDYNVDNSIITSLNNYLNILANIKNMQSFQNKDILYDVNALEKTIKFTLSEFNKTKNNIELIKYFSDISDSFNQIISNASFLNK